MQPGLNYDKHDPKFILLGKVFKFIENEGAVNKLGFFFKFVLDNLFWLIYD